MNATCKKFESKVLLFGEYSIILDSRGLALPFPLFDGSLSFRKNGQYPYRNQDSNDELKTFAQYLQEIASNKKLDFELDLTSFEFDLEQGLFFESSIPQGYGVGSSGALCAALYDRYVCPSDQFKEDMSNSKILELKDHFSLLESHFHGASSGVDPLISYLGEPVLLESQSKLGPVLIPNYKQGKGAIFLLNTGRPRRTEPLVNLFLEKCRNEEFKMICENELRCITDQCIESFLEGNITNLVSKFKLLSHFQYKHLSPMIPKLFNRLWNEGLESDKFYLKLCGAGGGGFLLGITEDFENQKSYFQKSQIRTLFRF